ncbi:MAG: NADP-specific glutamate dehydrogenase, partial [Muribaculaceae bacterium]|nr:NADP-specific glutamate dehydrogenase [Muribaculaceae bacterium]
LQAVEEVVNSIADVYDSYPAFKKVNLLERLCMPDRIISFRVSWVDDNGNVRNNMGYRVQHNNAIGPYKGGIRFHSSVNLSILKFLAFEQTFKNSLTTLAMGGAKGGSDFSPRGKSDMEVMRFCQAFVNELYRHIGPETDVPAGDIGVGGREVGYMFGWYKKMTREFTGTFTGKGLDFGGSLIRPEATGYGNVYFLSNMLATKGDSVAGKRVAVSGSGNVALYTAQKLLSLGATVISMSDSDGALVFPEGMSQKDFEEIMDLKMLYRGRLYEFAEGHKDRCEYYERERVWKHVERCDIAMPSATQNELDGDDARALLAAGCMAVSEGANMPSTPEAIAEFHKARILYAPGKAANAGGVSVSGLEMAQNSQMMRWTAEEVDNRLREIMKDIHEQCVAHGTEADGYVNYVNGANVAAFMKVARAMMAQGVV